MTKFGSLPLLFQPGEKWMYGLNTDLLGRLVEIWSGMTLEEFFYQAHLSTPWYERYLFYLPASKASRLVNFFEQAPAGGEIKNKTKF